MRIAQIEDLLDEFDFEKVKKVMDCLKWTYHNSPDDKVTIGELRRMARYLLERAYNYEDRDLCQTACGGFHAERHMFVGDTEKYLELKFVVSEGSNPAC